jgi:hypothetical protein
MPQEKAVKAERMRDLRSQVTELGSEDMPEILFQVISPGREPVTVYSTKDGSPTPVPAYMIDEVMTLTDPENGTYRFVADKKDAPEYRPGTVKCFLHPDSPERPILEMVGLAAASCPNATLASLHSKRQHGLHRHKQEWAAYQEFVENKKEAKREQRLDEQLEATLVIARGGQAAVATPKGECDICGKTGFKNVGAHQRGAHK